MFFRHGTKSYPLHFTEESEKSKANPGGDQIFRCSNLYCNEWNRRNGENNSKHQNSVGSCVMTLGAAAVLMTLTRT